MNKIKIDSINSILKCYKGKNGECVMPISMKITFSDAPANVQSYAQYGDYVYLYNGLDKILIGRSLSNPDTNVGGYFHLEVDVSSCLLFNYELDMKINELYNLMKIGSECIIEKCGS